MRYETHMHTREGSACGKSTGAEMARAHKAAGYDGIFVTDHFFNGNCAVPQKLPWAERVNLFCRGFENAKAEGEKIGLSVFFGLEWNTCGTEFLVYNLDRAWLLAHEDIDQMDTRKALAMMRRDGAFVIQAHPFRERDYIDHFQLYPYDIDGVEAINTANRGEAGQKMNERAFVYADMFGLPVTSGSDCHEVSRMFGGGIETVEPILKPEDYLRQLKAGTLTLLQGNE